MSLAQDIAIMVRERVTGTACVSTTCGNRVATGSAPVLRSTPSAFTFPHAPVLSHTGSGRGNVGCGSERIWATSPAMVAQARYAPNEKSGFLIML